MATKLAALIAEEGLTHGITAAVSRDLAPVAWALLVPVGVALATPIFTWLLLAAILFSPILMTWSIILAKGSSVRHARPD